MLAWKNCRLVPRNRRIARSCQSATRRHAALHQCNRRIGQNSQRCADYYRAAICFLHDLIPTDFALVSRGTGIEMTSLSLKPYWGNNGNTPTKNMKLQVGWKEHPNLTLPADFSYAYTDGPAPMFLGPKAFEWSEVIRLSKIVATNALQRRSHIFIWGRADYEDIFGGTAPHFTQWCYRLVFHWDQGKPFLKPPDIQPVAVAPITVPMMIPIKPIAVQAAKRLIAPPSSRSLPKVRRGSNGPLVVFAISAISGSFSPPT